MLKEVLKLLLGIVIIGSIITFVLYYGGSLY
ncbi:uncharacterized protein METZ01_LOCUS159138 [marine metagenome]|uniref:Uncharacterized protein n=1 Tax=marine metagenome TaxID=408172 RepID=A0A382AY27_9ZZZZ